jgi:Tfp pilus assembly protein PilE
MKTMGEQNMVAKQRGVSLTGLLVWSVILAVLALLAMKVGPEYLEYGKIKQAVTAMKKDAGAMSSVAEARKAFDRRADVDSITAITGNDLDVSKEGAEVVVSFAYDRRVPLFANVSLLLEFQGSSRE